MIDIRNLLKRVFPSSSRTMNARFDHLEASYEQICKQIVLQNKQICLLEECVMKLTEDIEKQVTTASGNMLNTQHDIEECIRNVGVQVCNTQKCLKDIYTGIDKISDSMVVKTKIDEICLKLEKKVNINAPITDINAQMWDVVGWEAGELVSSFMYKAETFKTPRDLLSYAAARAKRDWLWLEFGVYKGKTINHIAKMFPQVDIYGFDSFEGLPEDWRDNFRKGKFEMTDTPPRCREQC